MMHILALTAPCNWPPRRVRRRVGARSSNECCISPLSPGQSAPSCVPTRSCDRQITRARYQIIQGRRQQLATAADAQNYCETSWRNHPPLALTLLYFSHTDNNSLFNMRDNNTSSIARVDAPAAPATAADRANEAPAVTVAKPCAASHAHSPGPRGIKRSCCSDRPKTEKEAPPVQACSGNWQRRYSASSGDTNKSCCAAPSVPQNKDKANKSCCSKDAKQDPSCRQVCSAEENPRHDSIKSCCANGKPSHGQNRPSKPCGSSDTTLPQSQRQGEIKSACGARAKMSCCSTDTEQPASHSHDKGDEDASKGIGPECAEKTEHGHAHGNSHAHDQDHAHDQGHTHGNGHAHDKGHAHDQGHAHGKGHSHTDGVDHSHGNDSSKGERKDCCAQGPDKDLIDDDDSASDDGASP